jgi:hypothetical protein
MYRIAMPCLLLAFPVIAATPQNKAAPNPTPAEGPQPVAATGQPSIPERPTQPLMERQKDLIAKLQKPVGSSQTFDGVPVKDFAEFVADRFGVTVVVNSLSFRDAGSENINDLPLRIPMMKTVTLRYLLDSAFDQVGGTLLIRGDHLELVTKTQARFEVFGKAVETLADQFRQSTPLVHIIANRVPLDQVLTELSDQSGRNVLLDARLANSGKAMVTIRLINTPLDSAVNILAQMNDLIAVPIDNTIVVTNKATAAAFVVREIDVPAKPAAPAKP